MFKKSETWFEATKEAQENSSLWLTEANYLLFEKKNFGHSFALSFFSLEEAVKAFICLLVTYGSIEPSDEMAVTVFKSHEIKMLSLVIIIYQFFSLLLQKAQYTELDEEEIKELEKIYEEIVPRFDKIMDKLINDRMRGMYVDVKKSKILSPKDFSRDKAENIFLFALWFNRFINTMINNYEVADENERREMLKHSKKVAETLSKNFKRAKII